MNRSFTENDNGKRFICKGRTGILQFPLEDPDRATPEEGLLWYDEVPPGASAWAYVTPLFVDEI